jgi:hypothetical protein
MKKLQILTLAIAIALLAPMCQAQSVDEPRFVNRMLGDFATPSIIPGHTGTFSFTVNNPDAANLTSPMENASISVSIYRYATLEESMMVSNITNPPVFADSGTSELIVDCGNIQPGAGFPLALDIQTRKSTPHGAYFSQSSYFVRFNLTFAYAGVNYTMVSRGYFSDAQWELLKSGETGAGEINQTYLAALGYDGIIPDSAFSVRKNIPMWPFYILVGLTALSGLTAFSYHVLDNPGRYPKLEVRLLRLSGRLNMWKRTILGKLKRP